MSFGGQVVLQLENASIASMHNEHDALPPKAVQEQVTASAKCSIKRFNATKNRNVEHDIRCGVKPWHHVERRVKHLCCRP